MSAWKVFGIIMVQLARQNSITSWWTLKHTPCREQAHFTVRAEANSCSQWETLQSKMISLVEDKFGLETSGYSWSALSSRNLVWNNLTNQKQREKNGHKSEKLTEITTLKCFKSEYHDPRWCPTHANETSNDTPRKLFKFSWDFEFFFFLAHEQWSLNQLRSWI